ncbi:MAG: hypothetical protein ABL880_01440 [Methylotenera sp.]
MPKILLFLALFIALFLSGCSNDEGKKENKRLSIEITQALLREKFDYLDLSVLSKTDWDRVCIIAPYALAEDVEKQIGFKWDGLFNTGRGNEGVVSLLFIKDKTVVEFIVHPRYEGDFLGSHGCISREDAKFVKLEDKNGWLKLTQKMNN